MTGTTIATIKSPLKSKVNITAALLLIFTILNSLGFLPDSFDATAAANAVVGLGASAVIVFRTVSTSLLRRNT